MGKFDMCKVYKDRIEQIEIDCKKAIGRKDWAELARLKAEKAKLEKIID